MENKQLMAVIFGFLALVIILVLFNQLNKNIWINLAFGIGLAIILGFVVYKFGK